jgi:predicted acetyltransferase
MTDASPRVPNVELVPFTDLNRPVVERLWQLYRHDLSEFRDSHPGDDGLFKPGHLPYYFNEPERCGFLIRADGYLAGFALVSGVISEPRHIGEFFIARSARRNGVGYEVANRLLRMFPGQWEIAFQEENPKAARFWRRVATDAVGAAWHEEPRPVPDKPWIPPDRWISFTV